LLIDLNLPRTNIYKIVTDLTQLYPNLKIIIFSQYVIPKVVQAMMEYGVHSYISKTASEDEIINTIKLVHEGVQLISPSVYQKKSPLEKFQKDIESSDYFIKFRSLTERETEIISLLSKGMTNKEMASELNLSTYTIETHRKNMMKKLNLKTSTQLIYLATLQGVI